MNTTKLGDCLENFPFRERSKMRILRKESSAPYVVSSRGSNILGMKARNGLGLLAVDVEYRVQLGDLQEVGDFLVQIQEL